MGITHRQLEVFQQFMETGSVTATAERLRVSQPAVSKILATLEMDLKLELFIRERKRIVPSSDAHLLHREVSRVLSSLSEIETYAEEIRNLNAGELRIASAASLGNTILADTIASFARKHTNTRIVFNVTNTVSQFVINNHVDMGFSLLRVPHRSLSIEPLMHARAVCVVPHTHRLAGRDVITAEDLRDEEYISFMHNSRMRHLIDATFEQLGISRDLRCDVFSSVEACAMVERGFGVSIVEPLGVGYYNPSGISVAHFEPPIYFTFNILRARDKEISKLSEAFYTLLHDNIRSSGERDAYKGRKIDLILPEDFSSFRKAGERERIGGRGFALSPRS